MAPKKKKKSSANPTRGFATTSVPSKHALKVAELEETPANGGHSDADPKTQRNSGADESTQQAAQESVDERPLPNDYAEVDLEDAELQMLLDEHRVSCKADASRQAERLRTERRTLRLQATPIETYGWLSDELMSSIIGTHVHVPVCSPSLPLSQGSLGADELLLGMWRLYLVLCELELPHVDEVLNHVLSRAVTMRLIVPRDYIWGLQDALDWLAMHGDEGCTVTTRPVSTDDLEPGDDFGSSGEFHRLQHVPQPTTIAEHPEGVEVLHNSVGGETNSKIHISTSQSTTSESSEDDDDPSKLVDKYIVAKTALFTIQNDKNANPSAVRRANRLQRHIEQIDRDVLFDRADAESIWQATVPGLRSGIARQRKEENNGVHIASTDADQNQNLASASIFEGDDHGTENWLETMFQADGDDDGKASTSPQSRDETPQVCLHDFGTSSGTHPLHNLRDIIKTHKPPSDLQITTLPGPKHSNRCRLTIRWAKSGQKSSWLQSALLPELDCEFSSQRLKLEMKSIATATRSQAEAYLSTVALFCLGGYGFGVMQLSLRLAPIWRDIMKDLAVQRQILLDDEDKSILRKLRSSIQNSSAQKGQIETAALVRNHDSSGTPENTGIARSLRPLKFGETEAQRLWDEKSSTAQYQAMLRSRKELPIYKFRDNILNMIATNRVLILSSETGSGKSTQVPSYILEQQLKTGQDCRILITQPRRISATSLARRVSRELGEGVSEVGTKQSLVGYAIRMESRLSVSTRITFATTGVLLRMLESDPSLSNIDYVILDEVHERTMDLDLLFIVLRRLLSSNQDLKLVLMSATIDAKKLSSYFEAAPILEVPGRTYPVEVGFLEDAVEAVVARVGAFDTSLNAAIDIERDSESESTLQGCHDEARSLISYNSKTRSYLSSFDENSIDYELIVQLLIVIAETPEYHDYSAAVLIFMPGLAEIRRLRNLILAQKQFSSGWEIHLLHSSFSTEDMDKAFVLPPAGVRKMVISTNIAETGVTIPDITAVIDTCKEKVMRYDDRRQLSKLRQGFISRSSCMQRRGRAARVRDGLCFHLLTRRRYESALADQHVPEMLRLSLQDPVLRVKVWNLGAIEETLSQAIDPPTNKNIRRAVSALKDAGALTSNEDLTPLGSRLVDLPLDVELAKLCIFGIVFKCLDAAVTIAALVSSKSPFIQPIHATAKVGSIDTSDDLLEVYKLYCGWRKARHGGTAIEFCRRNSTSHSLLEVIEEQKLQLLVSLVEAKLIELSADQHSALRMGRSSRRGRMDAIVPDQYNTCHGDLWIASIVSIAFYPKLLFRERGRWRNVTTNQLFHKSMSLGRAMTGGHHWVTFSSASRDKSGRNTISNTVVVPEPALVLLLGQQAEFKIYSGMIKLDGKRVQVSVRFMKELISLRILREMLLNLVDKFLHEPRRAFDEQDCFCFDVYNQITKSGSRSEKQDIADNYQN